MMVSMIFPLVQLIVLGNAFGGKIRDARLGLVDQDGGTQALKIREAFDSVRSNMRTFEPVYYSDPKQAMEDVRNGKLEGAVIIPPPAPAISRQRTCSRSEAYAFAPDTDFWPECRRKALNANGTCRTRPARAMRRNRS